MFQPSASKRLFGLFCALLCLVAGCAIPPPRPVGTKTIEDVRPGSMIEEERDRLTPPGPPPFEEKLAPGTNLLEEETKLYSLFFQEAPLGEVLTALLHDVELNLSVESGVDLHRPVTVQLRTVTFTEALNMVVAKGADYAWKMEDGCLHIKQFEERIYQLDYLDLIGETEIEVGGDMLSSGVEDAGVTARFELKGKKGSEQSDVWTGVEKVLMGMKSEGGTILVNRSAGLINLVDTPRRMAAMVQFLDSLAESLHRQVFIEARIFEVKLNDEHKFGIDWSSLEVGFKSDAKWLPDVLNVFFNGGGKIFLSDPSQVIAYVDFLRTQGDLTVLSNPHLSVMNGQTAVMTVGTQFPYGDIDGVDRDVETGLITFGASIKRAILGLQLGLTPQISGQGMIMLHIVPTITKIQGEEEVDLPLTPTMTQSISNPVISLQEFATTVRVQSGQSIVLAGLISQNKEKTHQGLPVLSSIPGIGNLFKHLEEKEENRELVVLITPRLRVVP